MHHNCQIMAAHKAPRASVKNAINTLSGQNSDTLPARKTPVDWPIRVLKFFCVIGTFC
jgi:hypothetical protein